MARQSDDFVRLCGDFGAVNLSCESLGLDWPPPPYLTIESPKGQARCFVLESHSQLTDEQTQAMTHVARGALYNEATDPDMITLISGLKNDFQSPPTAH